MGPASPAVVFHSVTATRIGRPVRWLSIMLPDRQPGRISHAGKVGTVVMVGRDVVEPGPAARSTPGVGYDDSSSIDGSTCFMAWQNSGKPRSYSGPLLLVADLPVPDVVGSGCPFLARMAPIGVLTAPLKYSTSSAASRAVRPLIRTQIKGSASTSRQNWTISSRPGPVG